MIEYTTAFLENVAEIVEVVNVVLAAAILVFGFSVLRRLKFDLKKLWGYFLAAIFLFGVHEIFGSLEEYGIFKVEGLYALTEMLFILGFLISAIKFRSFIFGIADKKTRK